MIYGPNSLPYSVVCHVIMQYCINLLYFSAIQSNTVKWICRKSGAQTNNKDNIYDN